MNLEDHIGDVIRKARAMSGTSSEAAARTLALSEAQLGALEETGQPPRTRPDYATLARLLGLHAGKLETLAQGWTPAEKDLTTWRELRCFTTTADGTTVNCYLAWDEVSREA